MFLCITNGAAPDLFSGPGRCRRRGWGCQSPAYGAGRACIIPARAAGRRGLMPMASLSVGSSASDCLLDNCLTAAVITAFAANGVVDVPVATVGAKCQRGFYGYVVGAALGGAGLGLFAFRMCHCFLSSVLLCCVLLVTGLFCLAGVVSGLRMPVSPRRWPNP